MIFSSTTILSALQPLDYAIIGAYVLATLAVGMWFGRGKQNAEEYLLGGRSILWWVAGISYLMTLLSTVSMVGVPGEAYDHGITLSIQNLILPFVAISAFHLFGGAFTSRRKCHAFRLPRKSFRLDPGAGLLCRVLLARTHDLPGARRLRDRQNL